MPEPVNSAHDDLKKGGRTDAPRVAVLYSCDRTLRAMHGRELRSHGWLVRPAANEAELRKALADLTASVVIADSTIRTELMDVMQNGSANASTAPRVLVLPDGATAESMLVLLDEMLSPHP